MPTHRIKGILLIAQDDIYTPEFPEDPYPTYARLREEAPVQNLGREATRDVVLHGVSIPAGSRLVVSFGSANRDPSVFEAADEYRLDRGEYRHLAFGQGRHFALERGSLGSRDSWP